MMQGDSCLECPEGTLVKTLDNDGIYILQCDNKDCTFACALQED